MLSDDNLDANSLDQDQDRYNVPPDLDTEPIDTLITERFFLEKNYLDKSQLTTKNMQNYPVGRVSTCADLDHLECICITLYYIEAFSDTRWRTQINPFENQKPPNGHFGKG